MPTATEASDLAVGKFYAAATVVAAHRRCALFFLLHPPPPLSTCECAPSPSTCGGGGGGGGSEASKRNEKHLVAFFSPALFVLSRCTCARPACAPAARPLTPTAARERLFVQPLAQNSLNSSKNCLWPRPSAQYARALAARRRRRRVSWLRARVAQAARKTTSERPAAAACTSYSRRLAVA